MLSAPSILLIMVFQPMLLLQLVAILRTPIMAEIRGIFARFQLPNYSTMLQPSSDDKAPSPSIKHLSHSSNNSTHQQPLGRSKHSPSMVLEVPGTTVLGVAGVVHRREAGVGESLHGSLAVQMFLRLQVQTSTISCLP